MKYFIDLVNNLPNNMLHFNLYLGNNNLDKNTDNLKYLGDSIK